MYICLHNVIPLHVFRAGHLALDVLSPEEDRFLPLSAFLTFLEFFVWG